MDTLRILKTARSPRKYALLPFAFILQIPTDCGLDDVSMHVDVSGVRQY